METNHAALEGITVLDLSQFASGPVCTLSMAQLGANVIKVERPVRGEQGRPKGGGQDYLWAVLHANKKGITLDVKQEEGKELLRELIRKSDVMVENFAPGTIERLGFSYEAVHEINPRCIYCQIKGYAENSPYSQYPALDGPVQASGTIASQTGVMGGPPIVSGATLADDLSGHYALSAILAALIQRERTGLGQHVRINMQEVMFSTSRMSMVHAAKIKAFNGPIDNTAGRGIAFLFKGTQCPCDMFPTKPLDPDGDTSNDYVYLSVLESSGNKTWKDLAHIIGHDEWMDDPEFQNGKGRVGHRDEIYAAITAWSLQHTKYEAWKILSDAHVTSGAVLTVNDLMATDYMRENHMIETIDHHSLGRIDLCGCAYRLSDSYVPPKDAPDLGEHNQEIYQGLLGMDEETLSRYKEQGVI